MNIIAIIPARMGSSRFPGKPLALIHGVPMVGHVAFRTAMSRCLSATYVATCDTVIEDYCKEAGLACVMTGDHHVRCSTRTAEALLKILHNPALAPYHQVFAPSLVIRDSCSEI